MERFDLGPLLLSLCLLPMLGACGDDGSPTPPSPDGGGMTVGCDDGMRNGDETGVDCGGTCSACANGESCNVAADCASAVCDASTCAAPSCDDGVRNGVEVGTDCGGGCGLCPGGETCTSADQCMSGVCADGQCTVSDCEDATLNGDETDVDCGGPTCPPCAGGARCTVADDCGSGICQDGTCTTPACDDGVRNQDEADIDCGGATCAACADGLACSMDVDCESTRCVGDTCVSCADRVMNADETDVDCGGSECPTCFHGLRCLTGDDCLSRICTDGTCALPNCTDGVANHMETDVDCGGPTCPPCTAGSMCAVGSDCDSGACDMAALTCAAPSCTDMVRNGDETDVDCGGATCGGCPDGAACTGDSDCAVAGSTCDGGTCASCTDGARNRDETDIDCGGGTGCARCADLEVCSVPGDCMAGACTRGRCGPVGCVPFPGTSTDPFGYFGCTVPLTPTTLPCPDISTTGTLGSTTDDGNVRVPIGFNFDYYGTNRTAAWIGSNGWVVLDTSFPAWGYSCLPRPSAPLNVIAPWITDLYPPGGGSVRYQTLGTAPNRQFVVRWNVPHFAARSDMVDFTLVLNETTNHIEVCYDDVILGNPSLDAGFDGTVGIQGGTDYLQLSCNAASLSNGLLVQFLHP